MLAIPRRIWYDSQASFGSIAQLGEHLPYKQRVTGSSPVVSTNTARNHRLCGNSSVVERHLAKVNVAGSSLVSRSKHDFRAVFYFPKREIGAIAKR